MNRIYSRLEVGHAVEADSLFPMLTPESIF